jgi:hypothetical protein
MTSAGGAAPGCPARPSNRVAPPGLDTVFSVYPGLTPWATFLTRLAALSYEANAIWSAWRAD